MGDLSKAVIHCDVDCFYCQVETLDNPVLAGRPLAVHQGNSGGFVAVNYEARACGVRCGDGSDPGNLAARTFQQDKPNENRSLPEVRQLCPGLITKPMRSDRYRQVSAQLLALLSTFAANGQCEKTSYDDFYLEIHSSKAAVHGQQRREPAADQEVHVIGNTGLDKLPDILRQAVEVVVSIKAAVKAELGFSMSFGVAQGKLAARLAGPLHKPAGITVVPPQHAASFLMDTPILKVPLLRGQLGKQVTEQLLVEYVRDLAAYDAKMLVDMFGESTGQLLYDLGHAIDNKRVQAKGPQQSIACTKSYHGLRDMARVDEALHRLIFALWPRLLEERSKSGRVPIKLKLSCKQGGREQAVRAYTLPFPHAASKQLSATALGSIDPSLVGSAAVHTLIPNLAPRSRFTKPNDADISVQSCGQSHGLSAQSHASEGHATHGQSGTGQVDLTEWDESSGPHQEAREALFVAVTALLRPKIGLPVLVNFLSIAGEYSKDAHQVQQGAANSMLRFLQKPKQQQQPVSSMSHSVCSSVPDSARSNMVQQCTLDSRITVQQQQQSTKNLQQLSKTAIGDSSIGICNRETPEGRAVKRHKKGPLDGFVTRQ